MHVCFCCVWFGFSVLGQEISLGRTSPKWPILCRVGCKTLTQSIISFDFPVSRFFLTLFFRYSLLFVWLLLSQLSDGQSALKKGQDAAQKAQIESQHLRKRCEDLTAELSRQNAQVLAITQRVMFYGCIHCIKASELPASWQLARWVMSDTSGCQLLPIWDGDSQKTVLCCSILDHHHKLDALYKYDILHYMYITVQYCRLYQLIEDMLEANLTMAAFNGDS